MLGSAIIVFREVLELALVIGIVAAAARGVRHRGRWLAAGAGLGLAGAALLAVFAGAVSSLADGVGQELFNAGILAVAFIMLAWHNIWMASHGKEMAVQASGVGLAVQAGREPVTALLAIVGMAVLREGSEVVLFLYGILAQGGTSTSSLLLGSFLGLLAGGLIGAGLYAGLVRIPLRWFFGVTSTLVLVLAAGMAGQSARFLIQAGWLPTLADPLWDSSALVADGTALATGLRALAGYEAAPTGMQVMVWAAAMLLMVAGMWRARLVRA